MSLDVKLEYISVPNFDTIWSSNFKNG